MVITNNSCKHLLSNYVLSVYSVQNMVSGTGDTAESKMGKNFCPMQLAFLRERKTISNINKM